MFHPDILSPESDTPRPSTVRHKAAERDLARIAALRARRTLVSDTVQGLACHFHIYFKQAQELGAVGFFVVMLAFGC